MEYLYPFSFKEFLLAKNAHLLIEEINKAFYSRKPLVESVHKMALKEYRDYLCIGGMPKAILNYLDNDSDVTKFDRTIHEDITTMYIADMRKYTYTPLETINIQKVYESMPSQLAKENKKFKYSLVEKGATRKKFELPLEWLISSGLILKCNRINKAQTPLKSYEVQDYFKMYVSDIGLLNGLTHINFEDVLLDTEYMFKGAIAENYVAQVFASKRYLLHYWKSKSDAEVDFILDGKEGIIPVEVKADDNTRSKSLNEFVQKFTPNYSIRLSSKNFGYYNNIFSVPLYAAYLI